jgi:PhnB protein
MSIKQINPYLNFDGTAAKAIKLYESALGAKVDQLMRFGEVTADVPSAPEHKDRVMHCQLSVGSCVFMVSDTMPGHGAPKAGNVQVCLQFDDVSDMARRFEALSQGGKVTMPLGDTFWGATFGMLEDAYGVHWMFNCEKKK